MKDNKAKIMIIVLIIIGLIGWLVPEIIKSYQAQNTFKVKNIKLSYPGDIVDEVTLFIPNGNGPFPAIVFGAGSGSDKSLYSNIARGFANEGFVTLVRSKAYGRKMEKPWVDGRDDFINAIDYLKSLEIVNKNKVLVGGHSGSANVSYWVGDKLPDEIEGIIAIAGRWPPENNNYINTNIFFATGKMDALVPPSKIKEVAYKLTGKDLKENVLYGDFEQNNAIKIFISERANHLTEAWDIDLINEAVRWSSLCVESQYRGVNNLEDISVKKIALSFVSGMLFMIGIILLFQQIIMKNNTSKLVEFFSAMIYFLIFYFVWSSTISRYFFGFGPYAYRWANYLLVFGIIIIFGVLMLSLIKKFNRDSIIFDLVFILLSVFSFILISSLFVFIPSFYYGGSLILVKIIIVSVPIIALAILFKKLKLTLLQRLLFSGLSLVWLLPLVLPPK